VPLNPLVPVQPICHIDSDVNVIIDDLRPYPWFLDLVQYSDSQVLLESLEEAVISKAESFIEERQKPKSSGDRSGREVTKLSGDMGHRHRWRLSLPEASSMRLWRASRRLRVSGPQETFQTPSSIASRPTYAPAQVVETLPQCRCPRLPPLALTSRPSKRSGYANGGGVWGLARGEGSEHAAGVRLSRASCGGSWWNASRQGLHCCCWARRWAPGGRVASAFRVRCWRS